MRGMQRIAQVVGVRPEAIEEYERIHAAVWPAVLATIHDCNIRNYSIYRHQNMLFSYFEYHGQDYAEDMRKMAADPETQRWWAITAPMQQQIPGAQPGEWWTRIPEVFHTD